MGDESGAPTAAAPSASHSESDANRNLAERGAENDEDSPLAEQRAADVATHENARRGETLAGSALREVVPAATVTPTPHSLGMIVTYARMLEERHRDKTRPLHRLGSSNSLRQ